MSRSFVRHVVRERLHTPFTLLDVGCSGGIDPRWRSLEPWLHAFGFDPNLREIERLQSAERNPHVQYFGTFVGLPADHPFLKLKSGRPDRPRDPWDRLAVAEAVERRRRLDSSAAEKTRANLWRDVELADPGRPLVLGDFLEKQGIDDVDFVKIDVDGQDYEILVSLESELARCSVLGIKIEVNLFGSDFPTDQTLHNVDRFMKAQGFELFDLSVYRYANRRLPRPFIHDVPSQSVGGRVLWADALFLRDPRNPELRDFIRDTSDQKMLKLACILALCGLADCAAELVTDEIGDQPSPEASRQMLDLLVRDLADFGGELAHAEVIRRFERDDARFYGAPLAAGVAAGAIRPVRWARRAWRALRRRP